MIRNNKNIASIDFYDFLLTGKKVKDVKLQSDDVVHIQYRLKTVSIDGEVNRPGIYELIPGEDINDLINISGGLKITAYFQELKLIVSFHSMKEIQSEPKEYLKM